MEFDGKGVSPLAEYYLANGQILARKMFGFHGRKEPGNEELLRTRGGLLYYLYDRLGTVVALADRRGELVTRYYYDVFGQPLAGTFGPYNSYGLTGKEYDPKTGQYYFGARWLEPELGRWMTQDPFRGWRLFPKSLHRYLYVYNNPVGFLDLWGLCVENERSKQNSGSKVPNVPPAPPRVDIDKNIKQAKEMSFLEWVNKVREGGEWDYKRQGSQYEDFGNFNYGATGRALGIPEDILLRAAGLVQELTGTSKEEWGSPWGGPPYGDDPKDQEMIKQGIDYYEYYYDSQ